MLVDQDEKYVAVFTQFPSLPCLYTSLRHQADTHNRPSSTRSPTLHHSRCAPNHHEMS